MTGDWSRFHRRYDDPQSSFTRRLELTQELLGTLLDGAASGPISLFDLCAGEGRVALPVVARHERRPDVHAILIDSDREVCAIARATAAELGLTRVDVIEADAGLASTYVSLPRADLVVLSGVYRYLRRRDIRRTARGLRQLCASRATVLWTLGRGVRCTIDDVRREFERAGFEELAIRTHPFIGNADGMVAVHRMTAPPEPLRTGATWFRFHRERDDLRARLRARIRVSRRGTARLVRRPHRAHPSPECSD